MLFDELNAEFGGFSLDVCAIPDNAKCAAFYSPEQDGLQQVWAGVCWCNPPYGTAISRWVQKAYDASQAGALVVCLLPARCDTRWWHAYVLPYAEIRYLKGRLKFGSTGNSAPFPSAVVIFRPPASATEADQQLLDRLRWGKWTLAELQWLRQHVSTQELIDAIDRRLAVLGMVPSAPTPGKV